MRKKTNFVLDSKSTEKELELRNNFLSIFKNMPIPNDELLYNLGLFINRQSWSRILFLHELYKKILNVPGNIFEFGVRWGQTMAFFSCLRGIYEPYNYSRRIIGFDTFSGFPKIHKKDGKHDTVKKGAYSVKTGYEKLLEKILQYHEAESPIAHIQKFDLIKGDVQTTLDDYLTKHPETVISLAYIDFNLYEPTKYCLEKIRPYLTKGSILAFDDFNYSTFPGETIALREIMGLNNLSIRRVPYQPWGAFAIIK